MNLVVVNIQRCSFYDGPGIRTVVFLKGCTLKCPWCCNPECILDNIQIYFNEEKCLRSKGKFCNNCVKCTPNVQIENPEDYMEIKLSEENFLDYKRCIEKCPTGALGIYGKFFEVKKLIEILKRDKIFYDMSNGGITFSGGEPLLKAEILVECLKELKEEKIHTCIETSLFSPPDYLDLILPFVDLFIVDIKILDFENCMKYLGGNLDVYLKNVENLLKSRKECIFRFCAVKPYTFNEINLYLLQEFVKSKNIKVMEIFSAHNLAVTKYRTLKIPQCNFEKVERNELELLRDKLSSSNPKTKVNILSI